MLIFTPALKASLRSAAVLCLVSLCSVAASGQSGRTLYNQIKEFTLNGGKADVNALVFKRDRVEVSFTGTFYFSAPIDGKVTGAVFIGHGSVKAIVPGDNFERANVKRLLGVEDAIESDFKTAVFKFSDNTYSIIGANKSDAGDRY
jgi:hypothetical protein